MGSDDVSQPDEPLPPRIRDTALGPPLAEMIDALEYEIAAAQRDPSRSFEVRDGRYLSGREEQHLYGFRAEVAPAIPPETPIRLQPRTGDDVPGVLVAVHDFEVILQLRDHIGVSVDGARVSSEPWFILEALRARLTSERQREADDLHVPLGLLGLDDADAAALEAPARPEDDAVPEVRLAAPVLNASQREALECCTSRRLHFVWGPPGTGKTATLAEVVRALVRSGERVLVLAHANAAVDVAMLRIAGALAGSAEVLDGKVLRIGHPQLPEMAARPEILPDELLARKHASLVARKRLLEAQRREVSVRLRATPRADDRERLAEDLGDARAELGSIREGLRHALDVLVRDARVLGTTLSRMAIDDGVWRWPADAVIVDETSMATFPFVVAAALRATRRLLLFGDFRQLPPIALATLPPARQWLARDAFDVAGVRAAVDRGEADARVSLLDTQYRMAAPVADVVSEFAYGGRLRSAPAVAAVRPLADLEPWPGAAVVLVDTSGLGATCARDARSGAWSRANPIHALLAVALAIRAARGAATVGLVTPYRAQARLLAAGVAALGGGALTTAATVHRFQGSERDLVIFDLVDGPPESGASQLTGRDAEQALRLLNVAISRARGKLVVLANVPFVHARHVRWSPARTLLSLLATHGRVEQLDAAAVQQRAAHERLAWMQGWEDAMAGLSRDLARARSGVGACLPDGFELPAETVAALRTLVVRGAAVSVRAGKKATEHLGDGRVELRPLPPAGAFFASIDRRIAWVGGRTPTGAIVRVEGEPLVDALSRVMLDGD